MISLGNHFNISKEYSSAILSYFIRFYAFFFSQNCYMSYYNIYLHAVPLFFNNCLILAIFISCCSFSFMHEFLYSFVCFLTLVQLQWNKISKVRLFLLKENSGVHDCDSSISWKPMWMLLQCSCVVERRIKGLLTLSFELIKFLFQRKIWTTI